jgi:hypothetical protein
MNRKLQKAVDIFKELGWETATPENLLTLPVGTSEQKRAALDGLKSGEWLEFVKVGNTLEMRYCFDVKADMLALFAVRVGVDARRAANILSGGGVEVLVSVIARRGAKYAADFITHACVSGRRAWEHSASAFGNVAVRLVDRLNLAVPQNVGYIKDWSVYAAAAMGLKAETHYRETDLPGLEMIEKRFAEHVRAGVAAGTPATGPFGAVLPEGARRGWLPREDAAELVFSALDAAVRPGDRKVWLDVLDALGVTDGELCARAQALVPLLPSDAGVLTRLAPILIAGTEGETLTEVFPAAFSAPTKKAKQLVLKAALDRPCPENAEILSPWLTVLAGDKDKGVAALAERLIKKWNVSAIAMQEENGELRGLWQETPPVWTPPAFELGETSPEALTGLAAEMTRRPAPVHDVTAERFLAMANAVAYENAETARTSLRGLRSDEGMLCFVSCWVKKKQPAYGFDELDKKDRSRIYALLDARDYAASLHLGELPCLLSTPGMEDLSVSVPDLAARLALYQDARKSAQEADLFLALTRLDISTKTPEAMETLEKTKVLVLRQSGVKMPLTAGQAALKYLDDPVKEPRVEPTEEYWRWSKTSIPMPDSLRDFPNRLDSYAQELFSVFPHWGEMALRDVGWSDEVFHDQGLIMRQIARRAAPLPPGASVNFMASLRSLTDDAAADAMPAVKEAWERGLLRPGVADIAFLDWSASPPSNLAALAAALEGVAADGLLSVVWPVLDELIGASLKAPRLTAGTAELAELMLSLLPEVQAAVEKGLADKTALMLPNIRALAVRGGASRAALAAKTLAELLPFAEPPKEKAAPVMETPFDEVWPRPRKAAALIEDGVTVAVDWAQKEKKHLLFTLTLPGISDRVFQIVNRGWYYDIENEGQCLAYAVKPGTVAFTPETQAWLHWDAEKKTVAVCAHRNWTEGKDGPLKRKGRSVPPPLPLSLLTVLIGLLAQDGDAVYYAPRLLRQFIENRQIDDAVIRKAAKTLLGYPAVSPAKLARCLENDVKLLPILWPMLTESVKIAGAPAAAGEKPPVWINRILDIALRYAPYLAEAAKRGLIPEEDAKWAGLSEIAASKAKSTAVAKAQKLLEYLSDMG